MSHHPSKPLRILVVDDYAQTAEYLRLLLTRAGYDAAYVLDGKSALEKAEQFQPHVIVADLKLPGMDGFALGQAIAQWPKPPRLIAITGFDNDDSRTKAQQCGYQHYLLKPIDLKNLLEILDQAERGEQAASRHSH